MAGGTFADKQGLTVFERPAFREPPTQTIYRIKRAKHQCLWRWDHGHRSCQPPAWIRLSARAGGSLLKKRAVDHAAGNVDDKIQGRFIYPRIITMIQQLEVKVDHSHVVCCIKSINWSDAESILGDEGV